jgi:hypothetical protein
VKAEALIVNTINTTQFDSGRSRDRKNDIVNEEEISSSDSDSQSSDDDSITPADEPNAVRFLPLE